MVKRYELGSEWCSWDESAPAMVEDPTGDYVLPEPRSCSVIDRYAYPALIAIGLCGMVVCGILAVISQMGCPT